MPSPDLNNLETEIQLQQTLRDKITQIDSARDEFLRDVDKIRMEDECLRDFKALLEDLNTEKLALVNELRHINTDVNLLEQAIKQAEASRQKSWENAQKIYMNEMVPLRGEINDIRDAMGKDKLPTTLVDVRDFEEVFQADNKPNGVAEVPFEQPTLTTIWPLTVSVGAQNTINQQLEVHRRYANIWNLIAAVGTFQQPVSAVPAEETTGASENESVITNQSPSAPNDGGVIGQVSSANFGHMDPMSSGLSSLSRQQQPPMKTCTSCQQQIHRNAPICPLCKSKSRSRHPKKKQRPSKSDDQQQE